MATCPGGLSGLPSVGCDRARLLLPREYGMKRHPPPARFIRPFEEARHAAH
jgi:hypothetical protein